MANIIPEESSRLADPDDVNSQIREYAKVKATIDLMDTRAKELREKLFATLDELGYEDEKGNIQFDLDTAVEGIGRIEKQRRTVRKLNEPKAEMIIEELGLQDEVYELKKVLNEDALMAAFYEEKITEDQLDEMFPSTVTWALRTVKVK
jgi:hypothetical protein